MGLFLETAIADCCDLTFLKQMLEEISRERPKLELIPEECRFARNEEKAIQFLLNENSVCYEEFAKALSEKISSYVMLLYIYDEDFWGYFLYDKGMEINRFSPEPEYFGENSDSGIYKGNPEIIAKYFGINKEVIEKYLINWTDKHYEEGNIKAYENDEYVYTDCWQMVDFMNKLGFPYEW